MDKMNLNIGFSVTQSFLNKTGLANLSLIYYACQWKGIHSDQ